MSTLQFYRGAICYQVRIMHLYYSHHTLKTGIYSLIRRIESPFSKSMQEPVDRINIVYILYLLTFNELYFCFLFIFSVSVQSGGLLPSGFGEQHARGFRGQTLSHISWLSFFLLLLLDPSCGKSDIATTGESNIFRVR